MGLPRLLHADDGQCKPCSVAFHPQGVTLLNTAQLYGTSENCIGRFGIRASSMSCPRGFEGHHESNQCGREHRNGKLFGIALRAKRAQLASRPRGIPVPKGLQVSQQKSTQPRSGIPRAVLRLAYYFARLSSRPEQGSFVAE